MELLHSLRTLEPSWFQAFLIYTIPGLSYSGYRLYKEYSDRRSEFARDLLKAIGNEKTSLDKLLNVLTYGVAILCISFGWPIFFIWAFYQSKKDADLEIEIAKPDLNCAPKYLVARIDPHDAEITSYIIDPLSSVPALPFGHFNKTWGNFLADLLDEEDELWSFHITKGSKCGKYGFEASSDIKGYAKVRNNKVIREFITESD
uniref:hypothetical protein n=1 Tax=Polynucleobacter sp. TaxID=2029855 RepID=UPI0040480EE6